MKQIFYYNRIIMSLVDKYNFNPEEVMDLQRNLNQYYIAKDRETDLKRLWSFKRGNQDTVLTA